MRRWGEPGRFPLVLLLALASLSIASPAFAGDGAASLELFHGPDDAGSMVLKTLRVILDGSDLQVAAPPSAPDSSRAIFAGRIAPGGHRLEVEATLERARSFFSYMDGYRIKMRSVLDLEVLSGEGVTITSRVLPRGDPTAPWQERNRLVLTLSAAGGGSTPPADVASAAPEPEPTHPVEVAEPAPPAERGAAARSEPPASTVPAKAVAAARAAPEPEPAPTPAAEPEPTVVRRVAGSLLPETARGTESATARTSAGPPAPAARPAARAAEPAPRVARSAPAAGASDDCALAPIHFEFDRATLTPEARESLDRYLACLPAAGVRLRVEGHCDARGSDQYNQWLGWDRAAAVAAYLRGHGVPAKRVRTRFLGKSNPLCTESTAACHARNRRVEVARVE